MLKSKRANIPITILVIGIFAVCALALLSFYNSIEATSFDFVGISLVEKININVEKYSFSGIFPNEEVKFENGKWYFYEEKKVKRHWYSLTKDKLLFSIKEPIS